MSWDDEPPTAADLAATKPKSWDDEAPTADDLKATDPSVMGSIGRGVDYAKRAAGGMAQAGEDMLPFVEPMRKIGSGSHALQAKLVDYLKGNKTKDLGEYYDDDRAAGKADRERVLAQAPEWSKVAGTAAGVVPNLAIGMPGKAYSLAAGAPLAARAAVGVGNAAGRISGAAGMAALESGLSNPDQLIDPERAVSASALSGGIQTAIEGASPVLGAAAAPVAKGYNKVKAWLKENARDQANKAVTGWNKRALKKMDMTGSATADMSAAESAGDFLLGENQDKKVLLPWFGRPEDMVGKLEDIETARSGQLGDLAKSIDAQTPGGVVDGRELAAKIDAYADSLPVTGQTLPTINKLRAEAEMYRGQAASGKLPQTRTGGPQQPIDDMLAGKPAQNPNPPRYQGDLSTRTGSLPDNAVGPRTIDEMLAGRTSQGNAPVEPRSVVPPPIEGGADIDTLMRGGSLENPPAARYLEPPTGPGRDVNELLGGKDNSHRMTFSEIRAQKHGYKFDPMDQSTQNFGKQGSNELYSIMRKEENKAAEEIANDESYPAELRERAAEFLKLKRDEQAAINLGSAARDRVAANKANRKISPSDYAIGLGTAWDAKNSDDPLRSIFMGLGASIAHRSIRTRGSAFSARSMDAARKALEIAPEALGPYARTLAAAAKRGNAAFTVTHSLMLKNDPAYKALWERASGEPQDNE